MYLQSNYLNYAGLSNNELKEKIGEIKTNVKNLFKAKSRIRHEKDLEVDLKNRARMERQLCVYLLQMARKSKHKETRKWGKKLFNLIQNL
jgi:hypothetical protein